MAREKHIERERDGLPLTLADVVVSSMGLSGAVFLVVAARWAPGFAYSLGVFLAIAVAPPLFRAAPRLFPTASRVFDFLASFTLLPAAIFAHAALGPISDEVRPVLLDRYLAAADLAIFGGFPAVFLGELIPSWLTEVLFLCYYSYFLWPTLVGVLLYFTGRRREYDEYVLALALYYFASFVFYVLVPAVGPRFFLADLYAGPVKGVFLTPLLDSMMREPRFMADCFPSGHTAVTLLMLRYAWVHQRRFFWGVLPVAVGLIAGTVVCRFHYVIDIFLAVPMTLAVLAATAAIARARPRGRVVVPLRLRRPLRA
ncbi:MAG: phosphatase PAP2 family protein [Myxococcaceae bacterium]